MREVKRKKGVRAFGFMGEERGKKDREVRGKKEGIEEERGR